MKPQKRIGLIAGSGQFPILFVRAARRHGVNVIAVGIKEDANRQLEKEAFVCEWVHVGQLGRLIRILKKYGIKEVVMAGKVRHHLLFSPLTFDWRAVKLLASLKDKKANSLLGAVASELAKEGIRLKNSLLYLSQLVPEKGVLSKRAPSPKEWKDIRFGLRMAKVIAGIDVGQTLVVKNQAVIGVEAIEGTDKTIERAGREAHGNLVVVKVSKPHQDMRFDVPVVGLKTLTMLKKAGVTALAVNAGKTLFIEREKFIKAADKLKISVVAI